jgi:YggT family protein
MILILIKAVNWFAEILIFLIIGRAIMSWFVRDPNSSLFNIYQVLIKFTEPIVGPCRAFMSRFNTGMMDFSILVAFLLISLVRNVIITILSTLV